MKVKWNTEIIMLDGKPMMESTEADAKATTVGWAAMHYLMQPSLDNDGKPLSGQKLLARYDLGLKIKNDPDGDFKSEELVLVKQCVEKSGIPLLYGFVCKILEGTN